jgi:hypothetical protein
MAVNYASQANVAPEDRFDHFWSQRGAATHDMNQLRRHSSWSPTDWKKLSYFYMTAFGSAIKGLE